LTTGFESELRTTPLDHALSYSHSRSNLREEEDERVSYGRGEAETFYGGGNEKVQRTFEGSDLEFEERSRRGVAGEY
jgi:hypothetical protein